MSQNEALLGYLLTKNEDVIVTFDNLHMNHVI